MAGRKKGRSPTTEQFPPLRGPTQPSLPRADEPASPTSRRIGAGEHAPAPRPSLAHPFRRPQQAAPRLAGHGAQGGRATRDAAA